jgi:hypothetical protein
MLTTTPSRFDSIWRPRRWPFDGRIRAGTLAGTARSGSIASLVFGVAALSFGGARPVGPAPAGASRSGPNATIVVPRDERTIQAAVDRAAPGDLVLVRPGRYRESVLVTRPDIVIRGADRNRTILDGQFRRQDGVDVRANGVALENLTARDFRGNGFFWDQVDGYRGSYLTASRDGRYGLYASKSQNGQFDHSYASGSGDSGFYIGACRPCHAVVSNVVAENNAVGFSGTNASGELTVEASEWRHNGVGIVPNTLEDEPLPPQDGMVIVGNRVTGRPTASTPQSVEFGGLDGTGIALVGALDDLVARNRVTGQRRVGIVVAPNPGIESPLRPSLHNQIRANVVERSGSWDLVLAGAHAGDGNCFQQNGFRTSAPVDLEDAAPCDRAASAELASGSVSVSVLFHRSTTRHPIPLPTVPRAPAQPNMPGPLTALARPAIGEPSTAVDAATVPLPPPDGR